MPAGLAGGRAFDPPIPYQNFFPITFAVPIFLMPRLWKEYLYLSNGNLLEVSIQFLRRQRKAVRGRGLCGLIGRDPPPLIHHASRTRPVASFPSHQRILQG